MTPPPITSISEERIKKALANRIIEALISRDDNQLFNELKTIMWVSVVILFTDMGCYLFWLMVAFGS